MMTITPPSHVKATRDPQATADQIVSRARAAQGTWAIKSVRERLHVLTSFRHKLATSAELFCSATAHLPRTPAETIVTELLPLAAACRFLENSAVKILAPRKVTSPLPNLLTGRLAAKITRDPLGTVLILAPFNYPIFLPGVQLLQALVAGNAVLLKPGRDGTHAAQALLDTLIASNLPPNLVQLLPEDPTVLSDIYPQVNLILLTGSINTGRAVLSDIAEHITPTIMELSGHDACLILPGADLDRAARAIVFGRSLNAGHTCIAPQRIIVHQSHVADLANTLPGINFTSYSTPAEAITLVNASPTGLSASIFGPEPDAQKIAPHLHVGIITINDLIAPTADPRLPFTATKQSGFGTTRGPEGLLALTTAKTTITRKGNWLPHLDPAQPDDATLFATLLRAIHAARFTDRLNAWKKAATLLLKRKRPKS